MRIAVPFALALAVTASMPAIADDFAGDVPDLVWIDVGGAANDVTTDITLRGPSGIGATVNLEDVFDLPGNKTTARMFGTVRISPKRRWIDFGYVDISRSGTRVLDEDVEFGDYTYHAGGQATAKFGTQFMYAAFRYDFLHEEKVRISGSAGLTFIRLVLSVKGESGFVTDENGAPVTNDFERKGTGVAPVPMVGLNLDWALTRRLVVRTYSRFFKINVDAFSGSLNENGIRLNWYFVKNFGLGLGYDRTHLDMKELDVGGGKIMKAEYTVNGIGLFANLAF